MEREGREPEIHNQASSLRHCGQNHTVSLYSLLLQRNKKNQPKPTQENCSSHRQTTESAGSGFFLASISYYLYDPGHIILLPLSLSCLLSKMRKPFPLYDMVGMVTVLCLESQHSAWQAHRSGGPFSSTPLQFGSVLMLILQGFGENQIQVCVNMPCKLYLPNDGSY